MIEVVQSNRQITDGRLSLKSRCIFYFLPMLSGSPEDHSNIAFAGAAESSIPLLSIVQQFPNTAMDPSDSMEKNAATYVAVGSDELAGSSTNPYSAHAVTASEDEEVAANQGRLRRLFSFVQLLAFALTFMSSWEVIAM